MKRLFLIAGFATLSFLASPAAAQNRQTEILKTITIEQHLNGQIDLNLPFRDEDNREVRIGDYISKRPVILSFIYFDCPNLCGMIQDGVVEALKPLKMQPGKEFDVLFVSFNPKDTAAAAKIKKQQYVHEYGRPESAEGWHFLTGSTDSIAKLTSAAGFNYSWDEQTQQWAHAAAIMLVTPEGRLSRYFYGVEFPTIDVRLGLVEAANGKIGTLVEKALLYCYHYDPVRGTYGFYIMNILRLVGIATSAGIGAFVWTSLRHERMQGSVKS